MLATHTPRPDPAPAAVRAHQRARVDWAYGIEFWTHGRRFYCWVPVHYAPACHDMSERPL